MTTPCQLCERTVGDGLRLCDTCGRTLVGDLLAVPGLLADLEIARAGQSRMVTERTGGRSAEAPLPVKAVGDDDERGVRLLGEREHTALTTAVHGWARVLAEHLGVEIPIDARSLAVLATNARHTGGSAESPAVVQLARLRDGELSDEARVARRTAAHLTTSTTEVERLAVWLACHPVALRELPAADEAYRDITRAVEAVRRRVDRPADRKYVGRCPTVVEGASTCDANLWAEPAVSFVRCRACRQQHDVARLEQRAAVRARDMLCTMPELLRACAAVGRPVARRTGYHWAATGRILVRGYATRTATHVRITDHAEPGAVPVYRLGEMLDLVGRDEGGSAA